MGDYKVIWSLQVTRCFKDVPESFTDSIVKPSYFSLVKQSLLLSKLKRIS